MGKLYSLFVVFILCLVSTRMRAQADIADFNYSINAPDNLVHFLNTSTLEGTGLRKALWTFGDGITQYTEPLGNTDHIYQLAGTYNVCLKIYRYSSNTDSILSASVCKTITIQSYCAATFEFRDSLTTTSFDHHLLHFWALPYHNAHQPVTQVCWKFGDGEDTCINYTPNSPQNNHFDISHVYQQNGTFNVCIRIQYLDGCVAEKCKEIVLDTYTDSCSSNFEQLPISSNVLGKIFVAIPWHNNNNKPELICWDFGDGKDTCMHYDPSLVYNYAVYHFYHEPGLYNVCNKIIYPGGCESYKCKQVQVAQDSCTVDFEVDHLASTPLTIKLTALPNSNYEKKPIMICWSFGDGKDTCIQFTINQTGPYSVTHTYAAGDYYEICLKIIYDSGCEARICKTIRIGSEENCRADFEKIPLTTNNLLTARFRALPENTNDKKPTRICWQFGDGRDTCIQYPENYQGDYIITHTYPAPDSFEVCIKIIYSGGCESYKCKHVFISEHPESCNVHLYVITPFVTSLTRGFYIDPLLNNTGIERICWSFGDGTDTCIDPAVNTVSPYLIRHIYPAPGIYRACVKVLYAGVCTAYDCKEILIRSSNNICGGYITDSLITGRTIKFHGFSINNPSDQVLGFKWSFGDGTNESGEEVIHNFSEPGIYNVCLTIKTHLGCETHICKMLEIPGSDESSLQLSPNPVTGNLHLIFHSNHNETVNIQIINVNGMVVKNYTRNVTTGLNTWDFDVAFLVAGIYSVVVQSPNQFASGIFVKQ